MERGTAAFILLTTRLMRAFGHLLAIGRGPKGGGLFNLASAIVPCHQVGLSNSRMGRLQGIGVAVSCALCICRCHHAREVTKLLRM